MRIGLESRRFGSFWAFLGCLLWLFWVGWRDSLDFWAEMGGYKKIFFSYTPPLLGKLGRIAPLKRLNWPLLVGFFEIDAVAGHELEEMGFFDGDCAAAA